MKGGILIGNKVVQGDTPVMAKVFAVRGATEIARQLNIARSTVYKVMDESKNKHLINIQGNNYEDAIPS
ncbi:hypothetical protein EPW57_22795 [Salmonella enterica]|nr:hypothetical protein [Salmonella enterica]ECL5981295.1 helix-turn-helix domain-containing protein [Salmonella enterica]EGA9924166.1 helix-turn-helix domain-containing protein [Salmonella enterica subsp. enterica serovar Saintpaul]ELW3003247.1 helix-turn-helix domain-containing protein [Salmonella enterica]